MTTAVMNLLKTTMADQLPDRVITRNFCPPQQRSSEDLAQGIYTLIARAESDYQQAVGREAQGGKFQVTITGQFELAEDAPGSEIEDAEFAMITELKNFVRSALPDELQNIWLLSVNQSGQLEAPYGWIYAQLELSLFD